GRQLPESPTRASVGVGLMGDHSLRDPGHRMTWRMPAAFVALSGVLVALSASGLRERPQTDVPSTGTFSILGFDPQTGELGGAVQSRVFSVGNGVLWAEGGVGAVATQAIVDVSYGPQCLELLKNGMAPEDIIKRVWEKDPDPRAQNWSKQGRQFAVIDSRGQAAAFTGPKA